MDNNLNLISEHGSAVVNDDICASSMSENTMRRTIGKTTYIVNLHFKEQGQTFSQKLKRVLKADTNI
ncbi:transposon-encoded TnpW family protein [Eubacterium sp.]|uniref:transposon-encoded TnpW family protein n=1 Tax=Eubacterium sp. TaxID=142586 RepID=UPI002589E287|nr:transposon-encoded TnpW family protein [Eubacterium sp.]